MVVGSGSASKVMQPIMVLEMMLRVNEDSGIQYSGKQIQRVIVELDKEQTRTLVSKLGSIQKEVIQLKSE